MKPSEVSKFHVPVNLAFLSDSVKRSPQYPVVFATGFTVFEVAVLH